MAEPTADVTIRFKTSDQHAMFRDWSHALGLDDIATLLDLEVVGEVEVEIVGSEQRGGTT